MPKDKYISKECKKHGQAKFVLEGRGYYRCTKCRSENVAQRRRNIKHILVQEHGGQCINCGYDKFVGALQFHHRNKSTKEFGIAAKGMSYSIDKMREEAKKCDLLCSNCHIEAEYNIPA